MQLIAQAGIVECPACGLHLSKVREQDGRVAIMKHDGSRLCSLFNRQFRVDRLTGNAEEYHEA